MNIIILNGSPRKNGKISTLLHYIEEKLTENGNSVEFIDVCSAGVKPCTGCMACRSKEKCVLPEDDGHKIAESIKNCDGIIIGTPVYWGNMNGQLKCLFDRLVGILMGESKYGIPLPLQKGKKAAVITACTTPFPFNILAHQSTGAERALKEILKSSGFKICSKIALSGTKGKNGLPEWAVKKTEKCANKFRREQYQGRGCLPLGENQR